MSDSAQDDPIEEEVDNDEPHSNSHPQHAQQLTQRASKRSKHVEVRPELSELLQAYCCLLILMKAI